VIEAVRRAGLRLDEKRDVVVRVVTNTCRAIRPSHYDRARIGVRRGRSGGVEQGEDHGLPRAVRLDGDENAAPKVVWVLGSDAAPSLPATVGRYFEDRDGAVAAIENGVLVGERLKSSDGQAPCGTSAHSIRRSDTTPTIGKSAGYETPAP
jgi:hypothetical protein